jgi:Lanthionine synthetase C-like protein
MIDHSRHVPLRDVPWDPGAAKEAIAEIAADALAHFGPDPFWPGHPLDDQRRHSGIYYGATGVVWGLEYLRRIGAIDADFDFKLHLPQLMTNIQADMAAYGDYATHGSLLAGDMGTALVAMRLAPSAAMAELIYTRADANTRLPIRELMWGMPGSMLACLFMSEMTNEARWRSLFEVQAARLLTDLQDTADGPIWEQDLYGQHAKFLGPVHGYAGNMLPLMRGWDWLTQEQRSRVMNAIPRTLSRHAWRTDIGTSWRPRAKAVGDKPPSLCQYCHGAPGMVATFASAPFSQPELETLLEEGAQFSWAAGPLVKGSNLCHGTGGNGYAFLVLHQRTQRTVWLERARAFAMTAIAQCREARHEYGRGRYSLWTGDVGLAIYLWDCLTGRPRFPTVDVF